jgi:hypothetical protein
MALFADLSEAKDSIAAPHDRPDRDIPEINTLKDEVFTEGAEGDICTFRAELLDLLEGKKADLAVPLARVGVTLDAPFGDQVSFGYLIFLRSFFIASAYSKYFSCHDSTSVIMLRTSFSQVMGFYSHAVLQLLYGAAAPEQCCNSCAVLQLLCSAATPVWCCSSWAVL